MLLFVPGTKEGKPYSAQQFLIETWIDGAVREAAILVAVDMPEDTSTWNMLSTEAGDMGGLSYVMRTVGKSRELFYVDYDRFYIGGRELGVQTALQVGRLYPQLFAGVIGQSGDAGDVGVENFRNLPTFFAGGGAACTAFEEANRTAGYSNCTLKADGTDSDAWAWALERKRVSNPVQVTLVPTNNGPFRSYWLDTPRQEMPPGARIDATVDRAANRIVIDAKGVKQVTLYFNDLLLDLDKPVKISRNGVESEEKIGRSIEDAIAFVRRGTTDAGRIYVSAKAFDIPSPKE